MGRKLFHLEWLLLASCQGRWRRCGGNLVLCQCLMMGYDRLDAVPDCLSKIDVWGWKNKMFQVPVCIVVSGGGGCCGCYCMLLWWCRTGIGRNSGLNIDQSSAWFIASVAHEGLGSLNLFHPWAHEGLQEPCHAWWVIRDIERGHSGITHTHRRLNILTNRCRCPTNPNCPYWWLRECTIAQIVLHFYQLSNSFCLVLAASMVCRWQPLVGCSDSFSIFSTTPFFQAGWRMDGLAPTSSVSGFWGGVSMLKVQNKRRMRFFGGGGASCFDHANHGGSRVHFCWGATC